jgi:hypothetical protein
MRRRNLSPPFARARTHEEEDTCMRGRRIPLLSFRGARCGLKRREGEHRVCVCAREEEKESLCV